ncbi:hypothetical protein K457DRAFT_140609 [Linnemannia elongata AG-77]|uniref:Uncharacterized protein n=1 Tax=Linnemannia elongata AG-77 TaxID=1314771 RepID=A0A197JNS4_9FUNG|nr:hypothetical protein K457DRAFT_140609 [Linnemannia elongata AG-77]
MSSKDDDNFDLYDDPYVATGRSGGADPYAEDDDDYYNGDHGRGHDRRDRFQNTRDVPPSSSSSAAKNENNNNNREGGSGRRDSVDRDGYDHYRSNSNDQGESKSYGATSSASGSAAYDPAQSYDQKDPSSSYQSGSQYSSQQGNNYQDNKSYNQQSSQSSQQQQQQSASGSGGGRELG